MSHKTKVELPEANYDKRVEAPLQATPITIAVTEDGKYFYNDEPVSIGQLDSRFSTQAQLTPQPQVNVRGDKATPYRFVKQAVDLAQANGMRKVGFVATRERN
jgi:biopolymer transport protein ExbD